MSKKANIYARKYETLLAEREYAVRRIMTAAKGAKRRNRPIVILIGETHTKPADHIFKAMIISRLMQLDVPIAVGAEMSHDILFKSFTQNRGAVSRRRRESLVKQTKALDSKGHLMLKAEFGLRGYLHAPVSHFLYAAWLIEKELSVFPLDASLFCPSDIDDTQTYIDFSDKMTHALLDPYTDPNKASYQCTESAGINLRDLFMAECIEDKLYEDQAQIIVAALGNFHVHGNKSLNLMPGKTVANLLRKRGVSVCTVTRRLATDASLEAPMASIMQLLEAREFDHSLAGNDVDQVLKERELDYLQGFMEFMGRAYDVRKQLRRLEKAWSSETEDLFDHWEERLSAGRGLTLRRG